MKSFDQKLNNWSWYLHGDTRGAHGRRIHVGHMGAHGGIRSCWSRGSETAVDGWNLHGRHMGAREALDWSRVSTIQTRHMINPHLCQKIAIYPVHTNCSEMGVPSHPEMGIPPHPEMGVPSPSRDGRPFPARDGRPSPSRRWASLPHPEMTQVVYSYPGPVLSPDLPVLRLTAPQCHPRHCT